MLSHRHLIAVMLVSVVGCLWMFLYLSPNPAHHRNHALPGQTVQVSQMDLNFRTTPLTSLDVRCTSYLHCPSPLRVKSDSVQFPTKKTQNKLFSKKVKHALSKLTERKTIQTRNSTLGTSSASGTSSNELIHKQPIFRRINTSSSWRKTAVNKNYNAKRQKTFVSPFVINSSLNRKQHKLAHVTNRLKLVLFYNMPRTFIGVGNVFRGCDAGPCALTNDTRLFKRADAVIFNVPTLRGRTPPFKKPPGQIWVAFSLESPVMFDEVNVPLRAAFNWTMTYRTDSDIFHPYGFLVPRKHPPVKNYLAIANRKSRTAAWFVSHCWTQSKRLEYVKQLQKYVDVDVFGRCGTLNCPRKDKNCTKRLDSFYHFYLSFENSFCKDYVTEKFFNMFQDINVIPVVRGGADYKKYFPPGTFIDTADFPSPRLLARYLQQLGSDRQAYAAMLRHKDRYEFSRPREKAYCELCGKLHGDAEDKVYHDVNTWLHTDTCWTHNDSGDSTSEV